MKKPNVADVRIYSDVCMFNINTDEYFTYMRDKQFNTILRSAFEEDSAKIAKALNLDRKKKAIIEEELRKKNSENYYWSNCWNNDCCTSFSVFLFQWPRCCFF